MRTLFALIASLALTAPTLAAPAWIPLPDARAHGFGATALLHNGNVLSCGGADAVGSTATCQIFDTATRTWGAAASMPRTLMNHTLTTMPDGRVLVAGGTTTAFAGDVTAAASIYDPASNLWTTAPDMPEPRGFHAAALVGTSVLVAGFANVAGAVYDTVTGTWQSFSYPSITASGASVTALADGSALIIGIGNDAVHYRSPSDFTAVPMGELLTAHSAVLLADGRVLVAGGIRGAGTVSSVALVFDPQTDLFTPTGSLIVPRRGAKMVPLPDGRAVIVGGFDSSVSTTATVELYDPVLGTWSAGPPMDLARVTHTLTFVPGLGALVLGASPPSGLARAFSDIGAGCVGCTTGTCVDGVCCASACDGPCQECQPLTGACVTSDTPVVVAATATDCPDGGLVLTCELDTLPGAFGAAQHLPICNGPDFVTGSASADAVTCPAGGTVFSYGYDADHDAALDASEQTGSFPLCDGETATTDLVDAGDLCPVGGSTLEVDGVALVTLCQPGEALVRFDDITTPCTGRTVSAGIDANADATLADDEIVSSATLCDGVDGAPITITTTPVPIGTEPCLTSGGVTIDFGLASTTVCNGDLSAAGVRTLSVVAPATSCDATGVLLTAGLDDDLDGTLDESEIDFSATLCDGEQGAAGEAMLIELAPAQGDVCATARVGLDEDGDGTLSDDEVDSTTELCNGGPGDPGTAGPDGADGAPVLVTSTTPDTTACPNGGVVLRAGKDDDDDGTLDTEEIETTSTLCNGQDGEVQEPCTVVDHGNGQVHIECPDGEIELQGLSDDASGCGAGASSTLLGLVFALAALMRRRLVMVVALLGLGGSAFGQAAYSVTATTNAIDGQCSLTEALQASNGTAAPDCVNSGGPLSGGATITLAAGTYPIANGAWLARTNSTTLVGADAATTVVVLQGPLSLSGTASVAASNLTIDGAATTGGASITLIGSGAITLDHVVIRASASGAVQGSTSGALILRDTVIQGARQFGAVRYQSIGANVPVLIERSTFDDNINDQQNPGSGGLTLAGDLALTVRRSLFSANRSTLGPGGAINLTTTGNRPVVITDSAFTNNVALSGGAIGGNAQPSVVTLERTAFDGNTNGAIQIDRPLTMKNVILSRNTSPLGIVLGRGDVSCAFCTIVDNTAPILVRTTLGAGSATDVLAQRNRDPGGATAPVIGGTSSATLSGFTDFDGVMTLDEADSSTFPVRHYYLPRAAASLLRAEGTIADDFFGRLRPAGATMEIGAIEVAPPYIQIVDATVAECPVGGQTIITRDDPENLGAGTELERISLCLGPDLLVLSAEGPQCHGIMFGFDDDGDGVLSVAESDGTLGSCDAEAIVVTATPSAPDATCRRGGTTLTVGTASATICLPGDALVEAVEDDETGCVTITTGTDWDDDDVIDDDERGATTTLCNGADTLPVRVTVSPATTAQCPGGGKVAAFGRDVNDDSQITDSEIEGTAVICDGAPGAATVRLVSVTPTTCASGAAGRAIATGLDDDGDGQLDIDEQDSVQNICDGARGDAGLVPLVTITAADAADCPDGGSTISAGRDSDASGVLDANEVLAEVDVCDGEDGVAGPDGSPGDDAEPLTITADAASEAQCADGGWVVTTTRGATQLTQDVVCNGADGSTPDTCTFDDHGNGTATVTCPDGTTAEVLTGAMEGGGCSSGGTTGVLALLLALALLTRRARARARPLALALVALLAMRGGASALDYHITTTANSGSDGQCSLNEALTHAGSVVGLLNDCSSTLLPNGRHRFYLDVDGTHTVTTALALTATLSGFEIHGRGPTHTTVVLTTPLLSSNGILIDDVTITCQGANRLNAAGGPLSVDGSVVSDCAVLTPGAFTATHSAVRGTSVSTTSAVIDHSSFVGVNTVVSASGTVTAVNSTFSSNGTPLINANGPVQLDFVTMSTPAGAAVNSGTGGEIRRSVLNEPIASLTMVDTVVTSGGFATVRANPGANNAVPLDLLIPLEETGIRDTVDAGSVGDDLVSRLRPQGPLADRGALELPPRIVVRGETATAIECPTDGQTLLLGADYDNDGVISDAELVERVPLCNGPRFLLEVLAEGDCRTLSWGYDRDADGAIDDDERDGEEVLCDGEDGSVDVVDNEPDATCPAGSYILNGTQICKPGQALVEVAQDDTSCALSGVSFRWGRDLDNDGVIGDGEQLGEATVCDRFDGAEALVDVFPAETCPTGGVDILFGTDSDGNDSLGVEEIDSTTTLCNGLAAPPGLDALVVVAVANAVECPNGGSLFASGVDEDDDGVLDPDEIHLATPLCNGSPGETGSDALVAFSDATAAACPGGGTTMVIGLDADHDGQLVGDEVLTTQNVCAGDPGADGAQGAAGADGAVVLITTEEAAACPNGGVHLVSGLDDDGDGTLATGEIDNDVTACQGEDGEVGEPCTIVDERTMQCGDSIQKFVIADDVQTDGCAGGGASLVGLVVALAFMLRRSLRRVGLAALLTSLSVSARAQDTAFDVQTFNPQPHQGANLLGLARSHMLRPLEPSFGLFVHVEDDPLQLSLYDVDGNESESMLIDDVTTMELSAGFGITEWLDLGLVFPLIVNQTGPGLDAFATGDLRIVPRVRILDPAHGGIGLALQAAVFVPTGDTVYHSEGSVRVEPRLALDIHPSGDRSGVAITANIGWQNRAARQATDFGNPDVLMFGVGVDVPLVTDFSIQATAFGTTGLGNDQGKTVPIQVLGGIGWWLADDVFFQAGGGAGLTDGVGTPDATFYTSIAYTPTRNLCAGLTEDMDGYEDGDGCPEVDNDEDGILDVNDGPIDATGFGSCRNDPEDKDGFQDEDGCPDIDNDNDGVLDVSDGKKDASGFGECRNDPEDKDGFEDENGCPDPDNDKDGFLDVADGEVVNGWGKCMNDPETKNGYQDEDGCSDEAPATMEITDIVYFDFDKDTLQERSFPILDAVAEVLQHHTEFTKVHVEGHADEIGTHAYNSDLSRRRANRVREYLVGKGVAAERLTSEGYSWDYPAVEGKDEDSRAKNRRVVFAIFEINGQSNPSARHLEPKPD